MDITVFQIVKYQENDKNKWDHFVKQAKNNHFIFMRDYMDYHKDRFVDHSLLFFNANNVLTAIFPANVSDGVLYSHQGLTFGGFIVNDALKTVNMLAIFEALLCYCVKYKIEEIKYKKMPYIYSNLPSEEDLYALFKCNAEIYRRDVSAAIFLKNKLKYQEQRSRSIKRAKNNSIIVHETNDYINYWKIVSSILIKKYNVHPTHSLCEIERLSNIFPDNIKLFSAYGADKKMLAGTIVYLTDNVVHTQYLASSEEGRKVGALDAVIDELIRKYENQYEYFDFGISNENNGQYLNETLIAQKEGFGARAVCHDFYSIRVGA